MRSFFHLLLTGMAMLAVALLAAFVTMRLAIHGREVVVPDLSGLTLAEASERARDLGLSLQLENRFYSTQTPSGHILGQFPAAGATVRRAWTVRITESLGAQQVSIPDVVGTPERPASLALRRASLEVGVLASIAAPGESGIVLAQTPPPNAEGVDRPRVSLLLSESLTSAPEAFVMPQFTGMALGSASARATAAGLHAIVVEAPAASASAAAATPSLTSPLPPSSSAAIIGQSPLAGHRVAHGDGIRFTIAP